VGVVSEEEEEERNHVTFQLSFAARIRALRCSRGRRLRAAAVDAAPTALSEAIVFLAGISHASELQGRQQASTNR
jgi:hypothetical protein